MTIERTDRVTLPVGEWRCSPTGVCTRAATCARRLALIPAGAPLRPNGMPSACTSYISADSTRRTAPTKPAPKVHGSF